MPKVYRILDVTPQLIVALTINWLNCTALIWLLDLFWAHQSAILLLAIFSVKYLISQNY